ncbi:hypothetical protein [Desulfitobacterium sp.]|uniref:hypothetical protein n=1 Tax=Desulfitobacterium sp. TaxID=49981 RepID=UPI002B1ECA93|nr:hypothetical protein [Desulfitobacterium sp.]MEA4902252.1 hypothetical protein [Desulfitobacterium sp.]
MNYYGPGIPPGGMSPPAVTPNQTFSFSCPDYSESGFRKSITFLQSPAVGASFIAITIFFLIIFTSNVIFGSATLGTIGIITGLSVLAFITLILIILFSL